MVGKKLHAATRDGLSCCINIDHDNNDNKNRERKNTFNKKLKYEVSMKQIIKSFNTLRPHYKILKIDVLINVADAHHHCVCLDYEKFKLRLPSALELSVRSYTFNSNNSCDK